MKESDWLILDTLYREQSITKAADVLFMTQPSLTKRLKKIEMELDTTIVIRNPRGIVFTPQGEYLAKKAQEMLKTFTEIRHAVIELNQGYTGSLKIGVTNSFGRFTLPGILNHYKTDHPSVKFDIVSGLSSEVVAMVQKKERYIGFIRGDHPFEGIKHLISVDPGYIVTKSEVQLDDLPHIPRIEYELDPLTVGLLDEWWYDHFSVPPLRGMIVNHGDTCREMIVNGLGYGAFLVPDFLNGANHLYKIPMLTKDNKPVTRNTWMVCNLDSYKIPLVKNFVDSVICYIK